MEYRNFRITFFIVALFLALNPLVGEEKLHTVSPSLFMDVQNSSKGGGAIVSPLSNFSNNPANGALMKRYVVSALYLYDPQAFSLAVSDSLTTSMCGGVLYSRVNGSDNVVANVGVPIGSFLGIGMNFNYYSLEDYLDFKKITGYSSDIGATARIMDFIYIGVASPDLFTFSGKAKPRNIRFSGEVTLFEGMFSANTTFTYHAQHGKEPYDDARKSLRYTDFSAGVELTFGYFIGSVGYSNSSFAKDLSFAESLKSIGAALYLPGKGGLYGGYFFKKDYNSFALQLIWEPF